MKNKKSNFKEDLSNEDIITKWLQENVLLEPTYIFERVDDINIQHQGIDGYLKSKEIFKNDNSYPIDLKTASNYIKIKQSDSQLPTFAFELNYIKDNSVTDGWLFGDKYSTVEYYLLSWLWADNHPPHNEYHKKQGTLHPSQIKNAKFTKARILIVEKKRIQEYASQYRITEENYQRITHYIRNRFEQHLSSIIINPEDVFRAECKLGKSFYPSLVYSARIPEQPINIVIPIRHLEQLSIHSAVFELNDD